MIDRELMNHIVAGRDLLGGGSWLGATGRGIAEHYGLPPASIGRRRREERPGGRRPPPGSPGVGARRASEASHF